MDDLWSVLATIVRSGLRSLSPDLKSKILYLWNILKEMFYSNNPLPEDVLKESVQYTTYSVQLRQQNVCV